MKSNVVFIDLFVCVYYYQSSYNCCHVAAATFLADETTEVRILEFLR